jgi:hypothetical protein
MADCRRAGDPFESVYEADGTLDSVAGAGGGSCRRQTALNQRNRLCSPPVLEFRGASHEAPHRDVRLLQPVEAEVAGARLRTQQMRIVCRPPPSVCAEVLTS